MAPGSTKGQESEVEPLHPQHPLRGPPEECEI